MAYRSPDAVVHSTQKQAIEAAARWANRRGIRSSAFERSIERVEPIDMGNAAANATDRDSLTGLPIVMGDPGVRDQSAESKAPPNHRIYYRLATGRASIDVRNDNAAGDASPLTRRLGFVMATCAAALASTWLLWSWYVGRNAWFASHGTGRAILGASAIASVAISATAGELLLGSRARSKRLLGGFVLGSVLAIAAVGFAIHAGAPHWSHVERLLAMEDTTGALEEARAIDAIEGASRATSAVDDVNLRLIRHDADIDTLALSIRSPWIRESARAGLIARLRRAANTEAAALIANPPSSGRELAELADLVAEWMPTERIHWLGEAALMDVRLNCAADGPDAICFQRQISMALDAGLPQSELDAAERDFLARARVWFQAERERTDGGSVSEHIWSLQRIEGFATAIDRHMHRDPGVDLARLRAEIQALHPEETAVGD